MQKIIPFKKDILLENTIEEITSIALDHKLITDGTQIKGTFLITGEYRYLEKIEAFTFEIPFSSYMDDMYVLDKAKLDIDDFYYEIIEPNKLNICIDISVDNLTEKPLLEPLEDEIEPAIIEEEQEDRVIISEQTLFDNQINTEEAYMTYKVYIVREGDTIESIMEKYEINREQLMKYNVINELVAGEKIIIPHEKNK